MLSTLENINTGILFVWENITSFGNVFKLLYYIFPGKKVQLWAAQKLMTENMSVFSGTRY